MEHTISQEDAYSLLRFYTEAGVDECIEETPQNRTLTAASNAIPKEEKKVPAIVSKITGSTSTEEAKNIPAPEAGITPKGGTQEAIKIAEALAAKSNTLAELKAALESFEGLAIKRTANHTLFARGKEGSKVMIIKDTPSSEEDLSGEIFTGETGLMLEKMMRAIGINIDEECYLTYMLNWYLPGNRMPSDSELAVAMPFIKKHIELAKPKVVICLGDIVTKNLLNTTNSVSRIHGKFHEYEDKLIIPMFRPDYLITAPSQKALAWEDLLKLKAKLKEL